MKRVMKLEEPATTSVIPITVFAQLAGFSGPMWGCMEGVDGKGTESMEGLTDRVEDDTAFHDENAGSEFPGRQLVCGIQGFLVTAWAVRAGVPFVFRLAFIGAAGGSRCDAVIVMASISSHQAMDEVFRYKGYEEPGYQDRCRGCLVCDSG